MPGIPQVTTSGPKTFTPAEFIVGGQLVEARGSSRIGVAAAGSLKVLGVALTDAVAPEAFSSTPTLDAFNRPVLNAAPLPDKVAVAYSGEETPVKYAATAAFGDALIAAAAGQVTPAGATPDARTIVGRCTEPAGVAAGATGLMRIA